MPTDAKGGAGSPAPAPRKSLRLNDPWSRVLGAFVAAAIGAAATWVSTHPGTPARASSPASPAVQLTSPGEGARIAEHVTVSGTVSGLRPNQVIFLFTETFNADGSPADTFYPELGPCPVASNGTWTCHADVGAASDYGHEYNLWAAVVTVAQAYNDNQLAAVAGPRSFGYAGESVPPHTGGGAAITRHLVVRQSPAG